MARKTHARKRSSCQVEHWWEKQSTSRKGKGKLQSCSGEDLRLAIRHTLAVHHFGRVVQINDLRTISNDTLTRLHLGGIMQRKFKGSPLATLHHAYPEFFDWSQNDHLHEWDFSHRRMWQGQNGNTLTRTATRHMIEAHLLGRPAQPLDLPKIKKRVFEQIGLAGMLTHRFHNSTLVALRHAYPEFFDHSMHGHLHEWSFLQQKMRRKQNKDALARDAVRHILDEHNPKNPPTAEYLRTITKETFDQLGVGHIVSTDFGGSPYAAIRSSYPELFDLSMPNHLHEWDLTQSGMWQGASGDELSHTAIRHAIEMHHLGRTAREEDLQKLTQKMFEQLGLGGMLRKKFGGSTYKALRHAYPEFAEAIGRRIWDTENFMGVLATENPERGRTLIRDLMSHFGDDLVDVADILAVVYTGRLESKTALEALRDPSMRPWIVPFDGRGHGPTKPPIDDEFPFYLLEKDQNGVIAGIISRRLTEWRRKVLGARPSAEARAKFLQQLRGLQDKFQQGGHHE